MTFLRFLIASAIGFHTCTSQADELQQLQNDPANWVMPAGNYNNQRYSALKQINKKNIQQLNMAWSFSTGVLRGHEGNSLVIDDTLYIHTPFQ